MSSMDDVLQRVARGELTPDEALELLENRAGTGPSPGEPVRLAKERALDELNELEELDDLADLDDLDEDEARAGVFEPPDPPDPPEPPEPPAYEPPAPGAPPEPDGPSPRSDRPLRTVRVRTAAHALEIYADPAVAEVQVTRGSPALRRDGDTMLVGHGAAAVGEGARFAFVTHLRSFATFPGFDERIVLRVNPRLLLDVDVSATSLRIWGCVGGLRLRLSAASTKLDRVAGPLVIDAHSSSVKGSVRITGKSRIRCESSSVKLGLREGTDVKITSTNRLGKVVLPSRRIKSAGESHGSAVVGAGTGLLVVDATMSSVTLGTDL